ncbi:MAG: metallophosphoesterase family protein [Candidatus Omnitrophica bacterium]|nr:metallophosphoesterase family protein [Candidatus Omnitrophota bacterium]
MRYGIFSDVHSNLEAFSTVCELYQKESIDKYIFLGDIIGYGANPNETIQLLEGLNATCICGNHDWAATGKLDTRSFNPLARAAINWTKKQFSNDQKKYLNTFPLIHKENDFICVHATLNHPEHFNYIWGISEAALNFPLFNEKILFVGHSHKMGGYCLRGNDVSYLYEQQIKLEPGSRYLINAGSVGQPRDRDPRACICVYDSDARLVTFKRIEYNIKAAADKILENGLPDIFASRLYVGW